MATSTLYVMHCVVYTYIHAGCLPNVTCMEDIQHYLKSSGEGLILHDNSEGL